MEHDGNVSERKDGDKNIREKWFAGIKKDL